MKEKLYERKCPKCGIGLYTQNKYFYIKCEKNNSACLSCSLKGKPKSEIAKLNMSKNHADVSGVNNPFYGRTHTGKTKKMLRLANLGVDRFSSDQKRKLSEMNSGDGNPFYGKTHTLETRKRLGGPKTKTHLLHLRLALKGRQSPRKGIACSDETKRKMRVSAISRVKKLCGGKFCPNVNKKETGYFRSLDKRMGWEGIYYGKRGNKKQFLIEYLGYSVDYYDRVRNIVVEYDETHHYDKNWKLKEKDLKRQDEIKNYLKCRFYRYNESLDNFYEV